MSGATVDDRAGAAPDDALAALLQSRVRDGAAGSAQRVLRRRLIRFFRLHRPAEADALADIALERLARLIDDGTRVGNGFTCVLGVARAIVLEATARNALAGIDKAACAAVDEPDARADGEADPRGTLALTTCIDRLGAPARDLIRGYYGGDGGDRIRLRQQLADEAGIPIEDLRTRALRLREALEACLNARIDRRDAR